MRSNRQPQRVERRCRRWGSVVCRNQRWFWSSGGVNNSLEPRGNANSCVELCEGAREGARSRGRVGVGFGSGGGYGADVGLRGRVGDSVGKGGGAGDCVDSCGGAGKSAGSSGGVDDGVDSCRRAGNDAVSCEGVDGEFELRGGIGDDVEWCGGVGDGVEPCDCGGDGDQACRRVGDCNDARRRGDLVTTRRRAGDWSQTAGLDLLHADMRQPAPTQELLWPGCVSRADSEEADSGLQPVAVPRADSDSDRASSDPQRDNLSRQWHSACRHLTASYPWCTVTDSDRSHPDLDSRWADSDLQPASPESRRPGLDNLRDGVVLQLVCLKYHKSVPGSPSSSHPSQKARAFMAHMLGDGPSLCGPVLFSTANRTALFLICFWQLFQLLCWFFHYFPSHLSPRIAPSPSEDRNRERRRIRTEKIKTAQCWNKLQLLLLGVIAIQAQHSLLGDTIPRLIFLIFTMPVRKSFFSNNGGDNRPQAQASSGQRTAAAGRGHNTLNARDYGPGPSSRTPAPRLPAIHAVLLLICLWRLLQFLRWLLLDFLSRRSLRVAPSPTEDGRRVRRHTRTKISDLAGVSTVSMGSITCARNSHPSSGNTQVSSSCEMMTSIQRRLRETSVSKYSAVPRYHRPSGPGSPARQGAWNA